MSNGDHFIPIPDDYRHPPRQQGGSGCEKLIFRGLKWLGVILIIVILLGAVLLGAFSSHGSYSNPQEQLQSAPTPVCQAFDKKAVRELKNTGHGDVHLAGKDSCHVEITLTEGSHDNNKQYTKTQSIKPAGTTIVTVETPNLGVNLHVTVSVKDGLIRAEYY